jgi:hypothetical protein
VIDTGGLHEKNIAIMRRLGVYIGWLRPKRSTLFAAIGKALA